MLEPEVHEAYAYEYRSPATAAPLGDPRSGTVLHGRDLYVDGHFIGVTASRSLATRVVREPPGPWRIPYVPV